MQRFVARNNRFRRVPGPMTYTFEPHREATNTMLRTIFFISDGTGITAETIGASVLTQFQGIRFASHRLPFVDDEAKAWSAVERIQAEAESGSRPIVVTTVMDAALNDILAQSGALILDVFEPFLAPLENELGQKRQPRVGQAHGLVDRAKYEARIAATNFAMSHDDGVSTSYDEAEVILLGVSRSGKTPTCLYMALHFGVRAANYPLIPDDLEKLELPERFRAHREKLFALTIEPERLQQVREVRRPGSRYAALEQCRWEVVQAERLFRRERIPVVSTTDTSIEEIASKVLETLKLERRLF